MGFGSYDESEQRNHEINADDDEEGVNDRENEHEGKMTFETEASTDDLVEQLKDIKANADEE